MKPFIIISCLTKHWSLWSQAKPKPFTTVSCLKNDLSPSSFQTIWKPEGGGGCHCRSIYLSIALRLPIHDIGQCAKQFVIISINPNQTRCLSKKHLSSNRTKLNPEEGVSQTICHWLPNPIQGFVLKTFFIIKSNWPYSHLVLKHNLTHSSLLCHPPHVYSIL